MQFQIIDWYANDFSTMSGEPLPPKDDQTEADETAEFKIIIFGKMKDTKTIAVHLTGFKPYYFVELNKNWQDYQFLTIFEEMKRKNKFQKEIYKYDIVKAHKFYGFTNNELFKFLKIRCLSLRSFYTSASYFKYSGKQLYESNVHPLLRLIHIRDLDACGIVNISKHKNVKPHLTTCDIEIECGWKYVSKCNEQYIYPIKILSFDIECSSIDKRSFPKAIRSEDNIDELKARCHVPDNYVGDSVTQIGMTTSLYGSPTIIEKHIVCLKKTNNIDGAVVEHFETETELLLACSRYIQRNNPDIVTGYNIFNFDFPFLHDRAKTLGILDEFSVLGRFKLKKCKFETSNLSSSALGNNTLQYFDMDGRVIIDMMKVIMREHKLTDYKLETASQHFLKVGKNPITHFEIFEMLDGTPDDRKKVAEYCIQDSALCNRLMDKLDILPNNMNMGNVCSVPLSYILLRGQTVKIFSLIAKECRTENYLIKVLEKKKTITAKDKEYEKLMNSYKGAFVLDPITGFYKDTPIVVCDFSSLYPSCMIAENLSQDTWVNDAKYDNLPGIEYQDKVFLDSDDKPQKCRFVKYKIEKDGKIKDTNRGILPRILIRLLAERSYAKTQMEEAKEDFKKKLFNGKQLALKVTCNSVYGFCGAGTSQCHCRPIAGTTAAEGRHLLLLSKDHVEQTHPGSKCIYGDSILGDEPIIIKDTRIKIVSIESLVTNWTKYGDKEIGTVGADPASTTNVKVWSHTGWNTITKVIRHHVSKRIYNVSTDIGIVSCTEDHSLLDTNLNKIKPTELNSTKLLHCKLPVPKIVANYPQDDIITFARQFIQDHN